MLGLPGGIEMTHPSERKPVPIQLAACCPEAQADGVPCTELGRDCEQCARAVPIRDAADPRKSEADQVDSWTV
jgi:hypothetical protein